MTAADIAASTDIMGNAKLAGDCDLEVQTGNNEGIGIKKPYRRGDTCHPQAQKTWKKLDGS
ncbi:DUF4347 domain-containing protein [Nostoc sp.]|uniref:DUF4347 domain-containing protein n=1 Tax=Nostoc sp. TaxID=1180 RepID=UPI003FA551CD